MNIDIYRMDYKNGKIYKITDLNYTKQYIGSTTQPLCKRLSHQKTVYKNKDKNYYNNTKTMCHLLFDEFGVDNCIIILIEESPCENKEQLLMRENYYIKNEECINKKRTLITNQELKDYKHNYHINNKIKLCEKSRKYYEEHKEELKEKMKKRYALKKELIKI